MIEFHNINFRYAGGTDAGGLVNINLIIPDGQVILLCGQSGCGKNNPDPVGEWADPELL